MVFFEDRVDLPELVDGDRVIADGLSERDAGHSVGELLSGDVDVGPRAAVRPVSAAEGETLAPQPFVKRRFEPPERLVADEERLGLALPDAFFLLFHEYRLLKKTHKEKTHRPMSLQETV